MVEVSFFVCRLLAWNIHHAKGDSPYWQTCTFANFIMKLWDMIFTFSQIRKVLVKGMPLKVPCCSFVVSLLRTESHKENLKIDSSIRVLLLWCKASFFNSTPNDLSVPPQRTKL